MGDAALDAARRKAAERDKGLCLGCGRQGVDVQHRAARGMGGTSRPEINHGLANMACLCRSCHFKCEARDSEMARRGLWLFSWEDPATVPVILFDGRTVLLNPDGGYT